MLLFNYKFLLYFFSATSASVKPLTEGETYQFRVRGENAAGWGEPSKPTDRVKVEHQPEKPEFNLSDIPNEINVRAGQDLKIVVPYSGGHPPPTAHWSNDDVPVDEKRAVVEVRAISLLLECRSFKTFKYVPTVKYYITLSLSSLCRYTNINNSCCAINNNDLIS